MDPNAPHFNCYDYNGSRQHCYDFGAEEVTLAGLENYTQNIGMTMPDSELDDGYHMSDEEWLAESDGAYVEMGLWDGCTKLVAYGGTCSGAGGTTEYFQFWSDTCKDGTPYFHPIAQVSPNGNWNSYQIWNDSAGGNDLYQISINGILVSGKNTSYCMNSPTGDVLQVGMELSSPSGGINPGEYTGNWFANYAEYNYTDSQWPNVTFDSNTQNWNTCGGTWNCAMDPCEYNPPNSSGKCLDWARNSDHEWSDKKSSS